MFLYLRIKRYAPPRFPHRVKIRGQQKRGRFSAVPICARGGIGRHDGFRFHCASVQVQVLSGAPNLGTTYDTKTVIQIGWLFLYMARKPLKTLGLSALRMPRQTLRCPAFHSGVWAAKMAEKNGCRAAPFRKWTRVHGATAPWPSPTKSALREKVLLFRGGRFFVYRMVKASRSSVSV